MSYETFPVGRYKISLADAELGISNKAFYPSLQQLTQITPHPDSKPNNNKVASPPTTISSSIRLQWTDLRYTINEYRWQVTGCRLTRVCRVKEILQPQSGELAGGTITALMGPSGAGE